VTPQTALSALTERFRASERTRNRESLFSGDLDNCASSRANRNHRVLLCAQARRSTCLNCRSIRVYRVPSLCTPGGDPGICIRTTSSACCWLRSPVMLVVFRQAGRHVRPVAVLSPGRALMRLSPPVRCGATRRTQADVPFTPAPVPPPQAGPGSGAGGGGGGGGRLPPPPPPPPYPRTRLRYFTVPLVFASAMAALWTTEMGLSRAGVVPMPSLIAASDRAWAAVAEQVPVTARPSDVFANPSFSRMAGDFVPAVWLSAGGWAVHVGDVRQVQRGGEGEAAHALCERLVHAPPTGS
jgi:hypothetical protein